MLKLVGNIYQAKCSKIRRRPGRIHSARRSLVQKAGFDLLISSNVFEVMMIMTGNIAKNVTSCDFMPLQSSHRGIFCDVSHHDHDEVTSCDFARLQGSHPGIFSAISRHDHYEGKRLEGARPNVAKGPVFFVVLNGVARNTELS